MAKTYTTTWERAIPTASQVKARAPAPEMPVRPKLRRMRRLIGQSQARLSPARPRLLPSKNPPTKLS